MDKTGPKPTPVHIRFWRLVEKEPGRNGCWIWTGALGQGYGRINVYGKSEIASRISWGMNFGAIPDGLGVLHRCDNPPCVRPDHLFLGDQSANLQDAKRKGRMSGYKANLPHGEGHYKAILTGQQVAEILASQESNAILGKRYNISRTAIYCVRAGRGWVRTIKQGVENA